MEKITLKHPRLIAKKEANKFEHVLSKEIEKRGKDENNSNRKL